MRLLEREFLWGVFMDKGEDWSFCIFVIPRGHRGFYMVYRSGLMMLESVIEG